MKLISNRKKEKGIQVLQGRNGEYITGSREILRFCCENYAQVYSSRESKNDNVQIDDFLSEEFWPQLSVEEREQCEGNLTYQECEQALKGMMNDKAPSVSGYSKEFLYFWPEMGDLVISY